MGLTAQIKKAADCWLDLRVVELPDLEAHARNVEDIPKALSAIETESGRAIQEISASTATEVTDEQKQAICWLTGLRILRNRFTLVKASRDAEPH